MAAAATASTTATTCSSSSTSPGPHRRRQLNDIERDAAPHDDCCCSSSSSSSCCGGGADHHLHLHHHHNHSACCAHDDAECGGLHGHAHAPCGGRALLLARRKRAAGVPGRAAWMRGIVLCLLGLVAVIGFLGSHRGSGGRAATGAGAGGDGADDGGGGGLVHKVEVTDADVMGWTEENLTAIARRPPEPPVSKYVYVHGAPPPPPMITPSRPGLLILLQRSSSPVTFLAITTRARTRNLKKVAIYGCIA
jgi:hypothetical protein